MPCARQVPAVLLALLGGCASYAPLPLEPASQLKHDAGQLDHGDQPLPAQLGPDDIALLALRNNPDLRNARSQRGLAQAQMLAAGIPPNPSLSGSYGFLLGGPGTADAVAAGITQDLRSLVTLSAKRAAARKAAAEYDASLLWQEWQTAGKARLLAVDLIEGEAQYGVLVQSRDLLQGRLQRSRAALAAGDATLAELVPDLSAAADLVKQLDDLQRQQETRRRDLNALLGLLPDAPVPLAAGLSLPPVDPAAVRALLPGLPNRRPDLLALQLGYQAQEEKLRGAILAQFPTLSLGVAYASDTSDVRTLGPQISFDLPLFDRNQGNIAIEKATRQQLHDEYSTRLDTARSEVNGLLADLLLLQEQLAARRMQLAELERTADAATQAYDRGDIDERGLVDLLNARNTRRLDVLGLEQTIYEQEVAIATLTGAGMPAASLPATEAP